MRKSGLFGTCAAAILFLLAGVASAGDVSTTAVATGDASAGEVSLDGMLREADAIRTSDPVRFNRLVSQLDQQVELATPPQRELLQLMHGHQALIRGDAPAAIRELKDLLGKSRDAQLRFRAGAMLVNTYAITRQFEDGLKVLDTILPLRAKVAERDSRHHGLLAAGILYNQVGEFGLGSHYAGEVLADTPNGRSACIAGNLKLESLLGLKKLPDESTILEAVQRCELQKEPLLTAVSRTYLARRWFAQGKVAEAIDLLEKHLPEVEKTAYPRLIGEYQSMLAEYRMSRGEEQAAQQHAEAAIRQSAAIQSSQPLVVAYRTLYEIAARRNDPVLALARYRQYAEADKAYLSDVKSREMAYQIVRHQSLQQAQQIDLLNQKNKVLELQQHVAQQDAQNTRLLVLLLIVLLTTIGYWAYKIKRVQLSLRRMAETDALTSICNRHHFTQQSGQDLVRSARAGEEVALIMFDLDHFKSINDRFGHVTGDWVLRRVSDTCKHFCRRIDHLGRLGGEEFAILLSGCDLRGAMRVAEDCRVRIATIDTQPSGYKFVVTASFGVTATSLSGYDLAKLLSHADMMLYRAKREGRNRVCMFDGSATIAPQEALPRGDEATVPRVLQIRPDASVGG